MIEIIDPDDFLKKVRSKGPITSSNYFEGKTYYPDEHGLFSEAFFGIMGSEEYKRTFSWIDLNCHVIHPLIYNILEKRIEKKVKDITLSTGKSFSLDENGFLVEDLENGYIETIESLYKNRKKWNFRTNEKKKDEKNDEEEFKIDRKKIINKLNEIKNSELFFMKKLIVIPPHYRPYTVMEEQDSAPRVDEMNEIYRKIISLSNFLKSEESKEENIQEEKTIKNIMSNKMQILINELYDYVSSKVSKKFGLIRNLMLGRRVDFSGRSVITPNPNIGIGYVGIPLRMACGIFEPFMLYGLLNSPYSSSIPKEFFEECKNFLKNEVLYVREDEL